MNKLRNANFLTSTGRTITLSALHLTSTYEGCLEGTLETISRFFRTSIKEAIERYFPGIEKFVFLDDGQAALPPYCWIAEFHCEQPVHKSDPDYYSCVHVCWFTDDIPGMLTGALQEVVDQIDYEANAEDYDMMP